MSREHIPTSPVEVQDDFNWGATITVLILLLAFIGASFYVLVSSFMDIS